MSESTSIRNLSAEEAKDFKGLLKSSKKPVLIDFWAPWCVPCKMLGEVLENLQPKYEGKLDIIKIDLDEFPELASEYQVRSIPTLILFNHGYPVSTHIGSGNSKVIGSFIDKVVD